MFRKIKESIKKTLGNSKGFSEIVAVALVILFVILVAATPIRNLGQTTSSGISNLNTQMQQVLNGQ
ncbi:archaellin/type IV pilin N-terminal domain-containing protein [Thermoanaerobacter siderophilus]|uniref:Archaeal flagellin-like protein n=1 Tax=Thermoanaerobacter siderophilus SR4 TaxID=880478 RepID=I9KT12_9THEO|nr:archaellin/type IV pilin N-terminal domain-containing protein [Thermoanaerobacter siderophilus]EIV99950.1 archaeal flagellin-like protein [Thermoanaerobacter siderophilus SR4]